MAEESGHKFVYKNDDGDILGYIAIALAGANTLRIDSLQVILPARRQGIARTLLLEAIDFGKLNGASKLVGDFEPEYRTEESERAAKRFYESLGIKILKGNKLFAEIG